MPPDAFTFDTSGQLVMQTAIGGTGTLFGPLVGAAVWLFLQDFLQSALGLGAAWKLVLGVVFVLLVCFLRARHHRRPRRSLRPRRPRQAAKADGCGDRAGRPLSAESRAASRRRRRCTPSAVDARRLFRPDPAGHAASPSAMAALLANSDIDFTVNQGELRGIIGPNGAGKTTFFKMLTCEVAPTSGQIVFEGRDITGMKRHRCLPARPDQELPGQPAVHRPDGAREPDDRRARRAARQVPARPVPHARRRPGPDGAGRAYARIGRPDRPRRHAGLRARLWREAAAGDRPCARHLAEPAAARRAARRHEPARAGRDRQAAQVDQRAAAP